MDQVVRQVFPVSGDGDHRGLTPQAVGVGGQHEPDTLDRLHELVVPHPAGLTDSVG